MIIAVYEGVIKEVTDHEECHFGRNVFCNFEYSYHYGYYKALQMHCKGVLVQKNEVVQQGFFDEGSIDPGNSYQIVNLLKNTNDKQKETELYQQLLKQEEKKRQKNLVNSYSDEGEFVKKYPQHLESSSDSESIGNAEDSDEFANSQELKPDLRPSIRLQFSGKKPKRQASGELILS